MGNSRASGFIAFRWGEYGCSYVWVGVSGDDVDGGKLAVPVVVDEEAAGIPRDVGFPSSSVL